MTSTAVTKIPKPVTPKADTKGLRERQRRSVRAHEGDLARYTVSYRPKGTPKKIMALEQAAAHARLDAMFPVPEPKTKLPPPKNSWGKFGKFWGPMNVQIPKHTTSSARAGVLTPVLAPTPDAIPGPLVGIELTSRQRFTLDVWEAAKTGQVNSPPGFMCGEPGGGKSMSAKHFFMREVGYGRHLIVASDPRREWVPLAHKTGGQVIAIGPGSKNLINPLAEGNRPADVAEDRWVQQTALRRVLTMQSIAFILRPTHPLTPEEQAIIDRLIQAMQDGFIKANFNDVVACLESKPKQLVELAGKQTLKSLAMMYGRLVYGPMAGLFNGESTIKLNNDSPVIVIDTSLLLNVPAEVQQIAQAAASFWLDSVLYSNDGRYRIVVDEEAWVAMQNPYLCKAMDERIRFTGLLGVSVWLIFHEFDDIKLFGQPDSPHRNLVSAILSKCAIKVLFRQSVKSMKHIDDFVNVTDNERGHLTRLGRGEGFWHIGDKEAPVAVKVIATRKSYAITNTDAKRYGLAS